jgi:predicted lipid-binding transport protein (Tim44 family)
MRVLVKKFAAIISLAALAILLVLSLAEAKRLGGGSSFGSKPSYSRSYSKPVAPSTGAAQPAAPKVAPPSAAAPVTSVAAPQPSFFSRFGMGLGGLMVGGLIGSMLFGGGAGGWGGGGIGILEILLIGLVIFFAVKLLRRRSSGPDTSADAGQSPPAPPADIRSQAEQSWDALRSQPESGGTGAFGAAPTQPGQPEAQAEAPVVPPGFNVPEFLEGAKTVYARLQHSWDRRDLNDIALFTTPEVLDEIKRQAAADPTPSKTELLLINARLLEFREEARDTVTSVYFDVLMREDATEERPKQVREVWHFSRPTGSTDANWRLEGIQQLEA